MHLATGKRIRCPHHYCCIISILQTTGYLARPLPYAYAKEKTMDANAMFQASFQHAVASAVLLYATGIAALTLLGTSVALWTRRPRFARH